MGRLTTVLPNAMPFNSLFTHLNGRSTGHWPNSMSCISEFANMFVHEDGGYRWFMFIPSPRLSLRGCAKPCRPASSRLPRARAQRRAGPCSSCGRAANPGPSSMMQGRTFLTNQAYYIYIYNTYIMYALLFQKKNMKYACIIDICLYIYIYICVCLCKTICCFDRTW